MRRKQTSLSAAGIAVARGIESEKPEDERICYDPYARRFAPGWLYTLTSILVKLGYTELRGPGVMGFLVARDRYVDDILQDYVIDGLQQLVILGAGYDSRAYRFEGLKGKVTIFEVDHPATQVDKRTKLQAILGTIPACVTHVPLDFNTHTLEQQLLASGYDLQRKTLFIWQGVTMYLTVEAADKTLRFVVHYSSPGSAIVFDYLYHSVLEGVQKHAEVSNMRRYRFITGKELTFGIEESTVEAFLEERGFCKVRNMNANGLRQVYFTGKNAGRKIASGYGIALAEV